MPESSQAATIDWGGLVSLLLTAAIIMGSPGPATISLTAAGSAHGVRRSLGYLAGIIAGTAIVLLAVAGGITAALLAVPVVRPLLIGVSVAYIAWLAYHVATAPVLGSQADSSPVPGAGGGLLLGAANPKAWVAIAAVFASTRLARSPAVDAVSKVGVLLVMIVAINAVWLVVGASLAPLLRHPRRARVINVVLAAALLGAAAAAAVR